MKIFKRVKKGFTLVELVVVIAVIAILAAVSVGAYFGITDSANSSRLTQEAKQVHTAITTVALAPNEHSSYSKEGLIISDATKFEAALEENLGKDVYLTDVENEKSASEPTIYFSAAAYSKALGGSTVYQTFEYQIPEISGKKAVSDINSGESKVVNLTTDPVTPPPAPITVSLTEANEIGVAKEHNTYTSPQEYIVEGKIINIDNIEYGNMTIAHENVEFYIYGLYKDGIRYDALTDKPNEGDTITVQGPLGQYSGKAQMKPGELLSFVEGEFVAPDPIEVTLAEANAIGAEKSHNSYTSPQEYIVEGTVHSLSGNEGSMYITDGTDSLFVYKMSGYTEMENKPNEGDIITLQGVLGQYSGQPQIKEPTLIDFEEGVPPAEEGTTVTITFDDKSKRTEFDDSHQVWVENGITVTNNKANSTNNVADYSNPVRFYKNSTVKVEYGYSILGIEVEASESKFANDLKVSVGEEASVIANTVNIDLATPAFEYTITLSEGALRANSFKITYDENVQKPETPVDPEPDPETPVDPDEEDSSEEVETITTVLENSNTYKGTNTTYKEWTCSDSSGIVFLGQSAATNGSIQLRSSGSTSGIVVSTNQKYFATKISVEFASNHTSTKNLDIYGSENAYSNPSDLYEETSGSKLGSIVYNSVTELDLEAQYKFIGIRSSSGAQYLKSITIEWTTK